MANRGKQEQDLTRIAALQKFDGSFNLDDRLAGILGINIRTLKQVCTEKNWKEGDWATAVVLAFFATRLADLQADWELLADKSKFYLDNEDKAEVVEEIFAKALDLFPN